MKSKLEKLLVFSVCLLSIITLNGQTRILEVPFITQQPNGNLCWAASVAMASTYYGNNSSTCSVAEWVRLHLSYPPMGTSNCCEQPTPTSCNKGCDGNDLATILASEGLSCTVDGVISLDNVKNIINDNRPLIIYGVNTGAHNMIVYGYNNSDLYYIDPWDGYYINSYADAISIQCLGAFNYKWQFVTWVITSIHCPTNLSLHYSIGANANIHAQVGLTMDGIINNNSVVSFTSGNNICLNPGFEIQIGSTLTANITSNPCQ